jgi:peptidoglycan/LPS O-acetylase OafA/YrhL
MLKPSRVVIAIRVMWAMLAIAGVMIVIPASVVMLVHGGTSVFALVPSIGTVVIIALMALLIRAVSRGRNWARIVYGALSVIAILAIAASFFSGSESALLAVLLRIILIALYVFVLYLLFHPTSNQWFRRSNAAAP